MNDKNMKRLLKSNPKLVQYCIERIMSDDETARILRSINKEWNKKNQLQLKKK